MILAASPPGVVEPGMPIEYSAETNRALAEAFERAGLERPLRVSRYDAGTELTYDVVGVSPAARARVRLTVEAFVGGGFAGQVYRVRLTAIDAPNGLPEGLRIGGRYAVKVLLPPSAFARKFRDALYAVGFQAAFQPQVNPAAARAGALWQKLIRRAAGVRFGDERAVVDVYATFVDRTLGSCGEISEWIDGRTWRFEVDDRLDLRKRWARGRPAAAERLGSPEYRAKREFMRDFVRLLHDAGAPELARQYQWWTCKSQPNVLKRVSAEGDPAAGLTAVDFRAGLALLPLLPMSPGDVKLILTGLARGRVVQFDRGDLRKLARFVEAHTDQFADLRDAFEELKRSEKAYRDSQIDLTHNHVRLLTSPRLWRSILAAAAEGWGISGAADEACAARLRRWPLLAILFCVVRLLPALALAGAAAVLIAGLAAGLPAPAVIAAAAGLAVFGPPVGRAIRRLCGRADYRRHYRRCLASLAYLSRALRGRLAETLIRWHRSGRVSSERARALMARPWRALLHLPCSLLPAGLHRFLTDAAFAKSKLAYVFVRPVRLFFNADAREQWLREMVTEGRQSGMLTDDEADEIESRIKDPYIQKYLKALAVHVCTLPISQVVALGIAAWYCVANNIPFGRAWQIGLAALTLVQIVPISPGSFVRGVYVVYLAARERNAKDYNIALWLGFCKYVGYLAFPIQMAYHYPALARFMAAHWATGGVHHVPVFGERGALLEHGVFDLFYNWPLTLRRRMRTRAERRGTLRPRAWHALAIAVATAGVWAGADLLCLRWYGAVPTLLDLGWLVPWPALVAGALVAGLAGGATLGRRVQLAIACGLAAGVLYGSVHLAWPWLLGGLARPELNWAFLWEALGVVLWPAFLFALCCVAGALAWETLSPEPAAEAA
jgi:hypothetical protein